MNNANAWRNNLERIERLHSPLQELVTLPVALEFYVQVPSHCICRARKIHLH